MAHRVACGLRDRGHEVTVISTRPESGEVLESQEEGMQVFRFRPKNLYYVLEDRTQSLWKRMIWHTLDLFSRSSAKQVNDLLVQIQPDLVMTHNLKGIGLSIPRVIKKLRIPHVHVLHDVQLSIASGMLIKGDEDHWMNKGRWQERYERATRRAFGSPTQIISPSKFLLKFYRDKNFFRDSSAHVLPNPAPEFGITQRAHPKGPLKLLFLGSLEEHKGLTWLLDTLRESSIDFELTVAGKGSLDNKLKSLAIIDSRIKFFGSYTLDEATVLIGASDCTIVPSLCYENSPMVIYESLSCGVPVIASRIGGVPELIHEGGNGYLFEPGDAADLLEKIQWLAEGRKAWFNRQDEIRMAIADHAMTHYLDRLETILKEV